MEFRNFAAVEKPPKVSIITVTYNAEKVIEDTMLSVINQTYPNIEYLIIDGKSKDRTLEIVGKYGNKVAYVLSEPDKGLFDAMNKGIKAATGEYLWFMNGGDKIYDERTLEKIMEQGAGKDFIYGDTVCIDETTGNTRGWFKKIPSDEELSPKSFLRGMVICHQSMIVRKSVTPEYRLLWHNANDIDWVIRILQKAKSHKYVKVPFCYYLEGGFSANNRWRSVKERWDISKRHFGIFPTLLAEVKNSFRVLRRGRVSD